MMYTCISSLTAETSTRLYINTEQMSKIKIGVIVEVNIQFI